MPLFLQAQFISGNRFGFSQRDVDDEEPEEQEEHPLVQTKLVIGQPGDQYEQEADRVAASVTRTGGASPRNGAVSSLHQAGDQHVQRKCSACAAGKTCSACQAKKAQPIQAKPLDGAAPANQPNQSVVKTGDSGTPISSGVRAKVEPVLGADLSNVKVHSDASANKAAKDLGAKAFTHQNHIWLGPQQSPDDVELMAHEATHVAQQAHGVHSGGAVQKACACGGAGCKACGEDREDVLIQPKLEVNATRQFEAAGVGAGPETSGAESSEAQAGKGAEGAPPGTTAEGPEAGEDSEQGDDGAANSSRADASSSSSGAGTSGGSSHPPESSPDSSDGGGSSADATSSNASSMDSGGANASTTAPSATDGGANASTPTPAASGGGANASTPAPPAPGGGANASTAAPAAPGGAGGGIETAGGEAACTGGEARCYKVPSDQPVEEPAETPPNPPTTQVEAQTSAGDEAELPEIDDCPANVAAGDPGAAGVPNASAPAASSDAAATGASAAPTGPDADGGAGGVSPGAGGGGGPAADAGTPDSALQSVGSPLDGAIAQAEGQRGDAVAGYSASSSALMAASDGSRALRSGTLFAAGSRESSDATSRRSAATGRADQFFAGVADQLDQAIAFASGQVPDQLGAQAEAAKAQIAASIETQKGAISGRIERARGEARSDAALARQAVVQQAAAFVAAAEGETTAAIAALTASHGATMGQVGTLETTSLDRVNQIYATGRTTLEGLGTTVGDECTAVGDTFAATYRGFRHCTENGFWDGDLSERRSEAQENAAHEAAKGYHDRLVESARKRAREATRDGRKKDRCAVIASASSTRNTLDQQLANVIAGLSAARDSTITQAGTARDGLTASINGSLASTLRQLDQQEHDQRQAADDTGYMQQVLQEQIGHAAATSLQRGVADAAVAAQSALTPLKAQFASNSPPDLAALDQALSIVAQRLNATLGGLQATIEGGLALSVGQLTGAGEQGLSALDGVTQSNDDVTGTVSSGFSSSMSVIAGTDNFAAQRTGFTQEVQQSSAAGSAALSQALGGMRQACDTTIAASETTLSQAATGLERNLRQGKQGIECAITEKADEAASHEAPAWKRLVAVLLVILVIVIVIAVIVASGGAAMAALVAAAGPILAAAIVGAAVGAVTSGLIAVASNLWGNRSWTQGVLKAVAIGFVTGAAGGALGAFAGAGAGALTTGASAAVKLGAQFAAAMVSGGGLDVVTQFVMGGFSFDNFSWQQLGVTLVVTAVTFGIGHKIATARAAKAPPPPGETPGTTPTPEEVPTTTQTPEEVPTTTQTPEEVPATTQTPEETPATTQTPEGETPGPVTQPPPEPKTVWAHLSDGRIVEFQPGEIPGNPARGDIVDIPGYGRGRVVGHGEDLPNVGDVLEPPAPPRGQPPPVTPDRNPDLNWTNPKDQAAFGHSCTTHGQGSKTTRSLTGRAASTNQEQGQWLDNEAAAAIMSARRPGMTQATDIDIPSGLGHVIMPDGTIVPVTRARLVPSKTGGYTSAFPIL